eukprot:5402822-Pleurochrysis_carterae.AAC.1
MHENLSQYVQGQASGQTPFTVVTSHTKSLPGSGVPGRGNAKPAEAPDGGAFGGRASASVDCALCADAGAHAAARAPLVAAAVVGAAFAPSLSEDCALLACCLLLEAAFAGCGCSALAACFDAAVSSGGGVRSGTAAARCGRAFFCLGLEEGLTGKKMMGTPGSPAQTWARAQRKNCAARRDVHARSQAARQRREFSSQRTRPTSIHKKRPAADALHNAYSYLSSEARRAHARGVEGWRQEAL